MTSIIGRRNNGYHRPVLVEEAVNFLVTRCDGVYLDLTCGGGGHLKYLSDKLSPAAILVGIDRDPEAISATKENLKSIPQFTRILKGDFCRFDEMARTLELDKIDGILLDLGLSSHQLDSAERGFAYMQDGPLDMRMGREDDLTAEVVINSYSETELGLLFKEFGEEKKAKIAAWTICRERIKGEIKTTAQLRRVLESVLPARDRNGSLARIFQAIRIAVNNELDQLTEVLPKAIQYLKLGGHLVVISYHSLEDRLVKRFLSEKAKGCTCLPDMPLCICGKKPTVKLLTKKAVKPTVEEIKLNSRAKSARLRAAEKIG